MKEIGPNLSFAEISAAVIVGIIFISLLMLMLSADVFSDDKKESPEDFIDELKEKERKLKDKEEELYEIEKRLRGL